MTRLELRTDARQEIVDVTARVAAAVRDAGVVEGLCHLFVPHTTAGIAVNENADPDVKRDLLMALDKLVPDDPDFRHAEGNSAAHLKSVLSGAAVTLPVAGGNLELGTWGGIYFCEFDGPRRRGIIVRIQGEDAAGRPVLR